GQAEPAVTPVTTPSPSIGRGAGVVPGGVVGGVPGVVGASASNSIFVAAMFVPVLVPLTSSVAPGLMSAHVPRSYCVAAVTEILKLPIMKLRVGHDVPATSDVTGASPSTSSPSSPWSNATTRLLVAAAERAGAVIVEGAVTPPARSDPHPAARSDADARSPV